jgi:hypothetical protein
MEVLLGLVPRELAEKVGGGGARVSTPESARWIDEGRVPKGWTPLSTASSSQANTKRRNQSCADTRGSAGNPLVWRMAYAIDDSRRENVVTTNSQSDPLPE